MFQAVGESAIGEADGGFKMILTSDEIALKSDGKITAAQAMDALREAMLEDYGYAWSWHCNVAMAAQDAGAPQKEANERASGFMMRVFGVDTTKPPNCMKNRQEVFRVILTEEDKQYLNSTPGLQSLLYDLDLMPEQLREGTVNYARMMVLINWYRITQKTGDATAG